MQRFRSGPGEDLRPSHTGGDLSEPSSLLQRGLSERWRNLAKFIVAPAIILVIVAMLMPVFFRARRPALEMRCISQLRQIAAAANMYYHDQDGYLLSHNWHTAIRPYLEDDDPDGGDPIKPGGARDPLSCPADPTDSPVSYLYLNRGLLDYGRQMMAESVTPLVVDEYFHEKATIGYYDGRAEAVEKPLWLHYRNRQWGIRRNLNRPESFAYEPIPGSATGRVDRAPDIDRTQLHVWPRF